MKRSRKILLSFCIAAVVLLTSVCAFVLYVYTHPSTIKPLLEKTVSGATGSMVTIETLSYSLRPLNIQARGILLKSGEDEHRLQLKVPLLEADMALQGPFGHKTLVLRRLMVDRFSIYLSGDAKLPEIRREKNGDTLFGRLLKGTVGLFLFRDIKFQEATIREGDITAKGEDQILRLHKTNVKLRSDGPMEISCSAKIQWLSSDTHVSVPQIRFTTERNLSLTDLETKGTMTAVDATFHGPGANFQDVDLEAKLIYDHRSKTLSFEPFELRFEGLSLKQGGTEALLPAKMNLKTVGRLDISSRKIDANQLQLTVKDTLQIGAQMNIGFGDQTRIHFEISKSHVFPQKMMTLLPRSMRESLPPLTLSGLIGFKGNIDGVKQTDDWQWRYDLEALLDKNPLMYPDEPIPFRTLLSGSVRANGTFPEIIISVSLNGDETAFVGTGLRLEPFPWSITLTGKHPLYEITDLKVHIPSAKAVINKKTIQADDIRLQNVNGRLNSVRRSFLFPEIQLDSSLLKNLHVSLDHDGKKTTIRVEGKGVQLIESAQALNMVPEGWQIAGLDHLWLRTVLGDGNHVSFATKVGFDELRFQDRTSNFVGEKISLDAEMSGKLDLKNMQIALKTTLETRGGEILLDRFYFDLNQNAFFTSSEGNYDMSQGALRLSNLRLGLKNILGLDLEGTVAKRKEDTLTRLSIKIPKTPVKPVFHHFLAEPFKAEKPFLTAFELSGNLSADLTLKGGGSDWMVAGHTRWDGGELLSRNGADVVRGVDLDLPIWYQTRKVPSEGKTITGGLSIRSMALPGLPKQSLKIPMEAAGPNRLSIPTPTILVVPGGDVRLGPIFCNDIFSSRPIMDTSLTVTHHELNPILSRMWPRPIEGVLDGELAAIHVVGNTADSRGEIKAKVFGGEIILSDFGASGLFSSAPLIKLNAHFRDLRLAELTTDTSFGKVEGVLQGYVRNLEIAYGQPQRFDLLLETMKRKGVRQRISVKAVDNIARIGGGQSPFMGFASVYTSFFKEFPYEKIGVRAVLENDVFKINGTIKKGGKEYLMKRGGFSGVDVINQNPDNRRGFKDMVKIIKRITTSKSGPVIK